MQEPQGAQHYQRAHKKGVSYSTLIALMVVIGVSGYVLGTRSDSVLTFLGLQKPVDGALDLKSVEETYRALQQNYDGKLDASVLSDGASRGLVAAVGDRYTVFMDKKEAEDFAKELSGQVSGIGAEIGVRNSQPTILRVIAGSPAEESGVLAGDVIIGANDLSLKDADAETAAKNIRGDEGTSVKLYVMRGDETKDFTITRAKVTDVSVRSRMQGGVGIITLTRFDTDTAAAARKAAEEFKSQGVRGVVLDLRDNGGGYLDSGRDVAGLWIKDKTIVSEKVGDKTIDEVSSSADAILDGMPTVILVNGSSASASEIVAGALQEYGVAKLYGEKTFGKGTVQKVIDLDDGRVLKVTIARWYTPKGKNITEEGITPDVKVGMTAADINAGKDPQLDAAIASFN